MGYWGAVIAFATAFVAVVGDTHAGGHVTLLGWIALLLAAGACVTTVVQQRRDRQRMVNAEARALDVSNIATGSLAELARNLEDLVRLALFAANLRITRRDWQPEGRPLFPAETAGVEAASEQWGSNWWLRIPLSEPITVEILRHLNLLPARSLGQTGPYASPVPWGTDMRSFDAVIAQESKTIIDALKALQIGYHLLYEPETLNQIQTIVSSSFSEHLKTLTAYIEKRMYMEDVGRSGNFPIALLENGSLISPYFEWAQALENLAPERPSSAIAV